MTEWLIIISLVLTGIGLIIVEIIFIPGTTIVGILGLLLAGYGIYRGYENFGSTQGHLILVLGAALAFIAIVLSFKSGAWRRFSNRDVIAAKVNEGLTIDLNEGDVGESISSIKPIGKALFGNKEYEVTSLGSFITEHEPLRIIKIDNNKVFVEINT